MRIIGVLLAASLALPAWCWQDKDADKQKIRALRDYAKQGSAALPKITPYYEDGNVEVRREAVKAVVAIGTQRSLEPLVQATKDNDAEIQIRATDGLVNFYLPGYVEHGFSASLKQAGNLVTGRWTDQNDEAIEPDTPLRPEIVQALGGLTSGAATLEARANAARALGILRAKEGVPALVAALRTKDSRVLYESLVALQKIRDRNAGPRLAFLVRDLDPKVQIAAMEAAGILGVQEAVPELKRALEKPANKKVRRAALTALAQIPDPGNRAYFTPLIADKDDDARTAAAEALARAGTKADIPALEKAWGEERKTGPRLAQAFALTSLGNSDTSNFGALGFLVNNLVQKAWRGVALPYLSELCLKRETRSALYTSLEQALTRDEKTGIAQALAGSGAADAVPPLERLSRDEDPAISREALRALRIVKGNLR
jgi:HEAT repeat protein